MHSRVMRERNWIEGHEMGNRRKLRPDTVRAITAGEQRVPSSFHVAHVCLWSAAPLVDVRHVAGTDTCVDARF